MKILFLTDNFPPETNAPASRTFEHAREWVLAGHEVTVVTSAPNFPDGKVHDGFRNSWCTRSEIDGINVVRVKTYITANEGFLKRTLDYLSFMVTSTIYSLAKTAPDVVIATSPQFFTAVAGYIVSSIKRRPFILEIRDLWPASITAVGAMQPGVLVQQLERLELFLYRKASLIISVTESFRSNLSSRGIDPNKIKVITNGVDLSLFKQQPVDLQLQKHLNLKDKFVVGYIGTHGMAHALEHLIQAAVQLREDPRYVFLFVGAGAAKSKLQKQANQQNLTNVIFLDLQPKNKMPNLWSLCNVSIIPLSNKPLFTTVIPSKIFECMSMGIPLLASLPCGEATQIIESTNCGIVVEPESPDAIVKALNKLISSPLMLSEYAASGQTAAIEFSRQRLATKMLGFIKLVHTEKSKDI